MKHKKSLIWHLIEDIEPPIKKKERNSKKDCNKEKKIRYHSEKCNVCFCCDYRIYNINNNQMTLWFQFVSINFPNYLQYPNRVGFVVLILFLYYFALFTYLQWIEIWLGKVIIVVKCKCSFKALSYRKRESNIYGAIFRSSHRRCFVRKGVLRNFTKFLGKLLCQSLPA